MPVRRALDQQHVGRAATERPSLKLSAHGDWVNRAELINGWEGPLPGVGAIRESGCWSQQAPGSLPHFSGRDGPGKFVRESKLLKTSPSATVWR
jgi:hypothetical protein